MRLMQGLFLNGCNGGLAMFLGKRFGLGFTLLGFSFFSGNGLAQTYVPVYQDFYGTARWNSLEIALEKAQLNAIGYARVKNFGECVFVGYQWWRPNTYDPNYYEVTAAYTCVQYVRG
ncbi:hypothetical protein AB8807_17665 [Xanthomonas campestris pv. olitorii]|nr:hypothetical protein [Xanthomonas euvesicatoria]WVK03354.1 hypothetical protein KWH09_17625 [Xanthomonas campestris pv. olitorii]MCC8515749.1 hypothetical protein [Xanthomonas euvesicatoria pv. euvesicatoria]MCC8728888.1 hypothetical protein [Xanthomonas euvesicatoria pv. euvesicatoria]MCC8740789.1 hypothetical protein [Xanthomonas euvesicatoria pv. euvesicatoria]MCC8745516.1 hypothetical protein [Xanthomonas euvesicatoria pv. euvesicatoria]